MPVATPLTDPFVVVEHFGSGKAWEDFYTQSFGLLGHPLGDIAQADDVVAVVVGKRGQDHVGNAKSRLFAQKNVGVVGDGLVQRGALGFPVWDQFGQCLGVHDGARQNVGAGLGAFFQHNHRDLFSLLLRPAA